MLKYKLLTCLACLPSILVSLLIAMIYLGAVVLGSLMFMEGPASFFEGAWFLMSWPLVGCYIGCAAAKMFYKNLKKELRSISS
jgi:uncharacterized membrane protein